MSQLDQEMWQDYVVEVEDNLQELEPNLLRLEQESHNIFLLNDCFRNMHSIKGAAGYMGLEATGTLAHGLENLFDRVRQGKIELSEDSMNLVFACVDRLRLLLGQVAEQHSEKDPVDDLLEKINFLLEGVRDPDQTMSEDKDVPAKDSRHRTSRADSEEGLDDSGLGAGKDSVWEEDDDELLTIYAEEIKSLFSQMDRLMGESPVGFDSARSVIRDVERITHYVGLEDELEQVRNIGAELDRFKDAGKLYAEDLGKIRDRLSSVLERALGPLSSNIEPEGPQMAVGAEEDDELYTIFLEYVRELSGPLKNVPDTMDETWLSECHKAVESLKVSAHYMDYGEIVAVLDEWGERLAEILSGNTEEENIDLTSLKDLWRRLTNLLPGISLEADDQPQPGSGLQQDTDSLIGDLESALDEMFDNQELFVGPGQEGAEDVQDADSDPAGVTGAEGSVDSAESRPAVPQDTELPVTERAETAQADSAAGPREQCREPAENAASEAGGKTGAFPACTGAVSTKTVRIDLEKVEHLLNDVGELVVLRSGISRIAQDMKILYRSLIEQRILGSRELGPHKDLMMRLAEHSDAMGRVVDQLQDEVMQMRMLPVSHLFNRYPRMVRDLARKLDKKVELHIEGAETALDKRVIEQMADPLLHIIRNAVDHGIEKPDLRMKFGKEPAGKLVLSATQEGNFVVLKIRDDGRGFDREALVEKAVSMGILGRREAGALPDEKLWNIIFLPGVSTAYMVSDTSGRGVGMDVVRKNVEKLGGSIKIRSFPGQGAEFTVRIPLTLAIIHALLVRVGHQILAIPLSVVQETLRVSPEEASSVEGYEIISIRQQTVPLIRLNRVFRGTGAEDSPDRLFVVMVKQGEIEAGLGVDQLLGQQQIVIKPLAEYLTDQPGFSGATILGDGSIALILDIPAVLDRAKSFILRRQHMMEKMTMGLEEAGGMIH